MPFITQLFHSFATQAAEQVQQIYEKSFIQAFGAKSGKKQTLPMNEGQIMCNRESY